MICILALIQRGLSMRTECPKCESKAAQIMRDGPDIVLKCLCGFLKVLETTLGTMKAVKIDSGADVRMPRPKSNLFKTLMCVSILDEPTSAEVTQRLQDLGVDHNVSDVSSYLTILRSKGLVETTVIRRGVAGGSSWRLTQATLGLMHLC